MTIENEDGFFRLGGKREVNGGAVGGGNKIMSDVGSRFPWPGGLCQRKIAFPGTGTACPKP